MKPTVSVIMPNFNHARFLSGAVKALVDQTLPPLEIVLIDDGSTDGSLAVMQELAERYGCLTIVENGENMGTAESCNRGLAVARGDHLLFAAVDDLVLPGLIETGLSWFAAHPEAAMCCHTYLMYEVDSGRVKELDYLWSEQARYFSPAEFAEVLPGWSIQTQGTIYDRAKFEAAGGIPASLAWHGDWYLNHLLAFRHGICYVPQPGTVRREHGDSYSQKGRSDWARQSRIVRTMLELFLAEEQRDILPHVARAQLMAFFGDELSRLYYSDPALWTPEVLTLALPCLQPSVATGPARRQRIFDHLKDTPQRDFVLRAFEGL